MGVRERPASTNSSAITSIVFGSSIYTLLTGGTGQAVLRVAGPAVAVQDRPPGLGLDLRTELEALNCSGVLAGVGGAGGSDGDGHFAGVGAFDDGLGVAVQVQDEGGFGVPGG